MPSAIAKNLRQRFLMLTLLLFATASAIGDMLSTETVGGVEVEIRRAGNGVYPLVIFSHGMGSCPKSADGIQSRLADAGYVVVAPKHQDCHTGSTRPDVAWSEPESWTDQTNRDRRDDIHAVLDVGCMGHSMGGYTCMGLAGAWSTWTRSEIRSVVALSPWHRPYLVQNRVSDMSNDQTLYQGGTLDRPISADLTQPKGTFDQTLPSTYLQVFRRAGHSAWTDRGLSSRFHDQMSYYLVAFFDAYLKDGSLADLEVKKSRVKNLEFKY